MKGVSNFKNNFSLKVSNFKHEGVPAAAGTSLSNQSSKN